MKYSFELTDTYAGEANYSWVERAQVDLADDISNRTLVRRAKAWAGLTGVRSRVEHSGDWVAIRPRGICRVLFISVDN
jgi:hypothetical protein